MIALAADVLSWALLLGGSGFLLIGGIGVLRMPDFYTRLHPAGITDTMGAGLVLIGLMLQGGLSLVTAKLLLIFLFIFFTSPTSSHAIARAALAAGLRPLQARDLEGHGAAGDKAADPSRS
jgi:multicomponent Na+:H+ antiporter subunit G